VIPGTHVPMHMYIRLCVCMFGTRSGTHNVTRNFVYKMTITVCTFFVHVRRTSVPFSCTNLHSSCFHEWGWGREISKIFSDRDIKPSSIDLTERHPYPKSRTVQDNNYISIHFLMKLVHNLFILSFVKAQAQSKPHYIVECYYNG